MSTFSKDSKDSKDTAGEREAMARAIAATAARLHGIESRSASEQIAAEVLRLNDAVRAGAAGRITSGAQPADFAALLLANADSFSVRVAS